MRSINDQLEARFKSRFQTAANNADPQAIIWLSRPTVPLTDPIFLEQTVVAELADLTACDVAMRRTRRGREPDRAFVAYISNGTAGVKSAALTPKIEDMIWTAEGFSQAADDVAIAFDGRMPRAVDGTAEFVTDERPWVFWTKDGVLKGRILGLLGETELASANATKVTAIRATGGERDFGLVVFFLLNGAIYYRQLIDNVWMDAEQVTFGPSGVTWADIAAFRTWDYRTGIQGITTTGDVYELFTQFQGIGRHGAEHLALNADVSGEMLEIRYTDSAETENLGISAAVYVGPYGGLYQTGNPAIVSAYNLPDVNDDWGHIAVFVFDRHLVADEVAAQYAAFSIVDNRGTSFVAQSATLGADGKTVTMEFLDFNNARGACSAIYTPGTVHSMADVALVSTSLSFTPQNLIPSAVPAPQVVSVENV